MPTEKNKNKKEKLYTPLKIVAYLEDRLEYRVLVEIAMSITKEVYKYQVFEFYDDAEQFLKSLENSDTIPSLFILDDHMPESVKNGLDFIKENSKSGVKYIGISSTDKELENFKNNGAVGFLIKNANLINTIPELVNDIPLFLNGTLKWKTYGF